MLAADERRQLLLERVLPYLEEVHLSCGVAKQHENFECYEADFKDLSVHRFPIELLESAIAKELDLVERMDAVDSYEHSKEIDA